MKRTVLLICFTLVLFFNLVSHCQATIYKTSSEYGNDNTLTFVDVVHEKNNLTLINEDGSIKKIDLSKENIWGYRNKWGEDYRIRNSHDSQRIIEFGKICIYSTKKTAATTSTPDISPDWEDNPYKLGKVNSFSIDSNGKIIKFSKRKLLKALRSDPKTYRKFLNYINDNSDELLIKIIEYNDKFR